MSGRRSRGTSHIIHPSRATAARCRFQSLVVTVRERYLQATCWTTTTVRVWSRQLPPGSTGQLRQVTRGRELQTVDDLLRPVACPELTEIARRLPADTAYQIMRTADRLGFEASDVLAEVVNAVTRTARSPKAGRRDLRNDLDRGHPGVRVTPARLAGSSFPRPPLARQGAAAPQRQRPGRQHP